ncbi:uncharacterized protein LOC135335654 isoform X5 [Halichondria panicea]|uniref:uncharacterized protein LOC135335654 isoform X5 n=1 Tax=Halichondria panicea TaxID=6063 RepID=UPI00312B86AB
MSRKITVNDLKVEKEVTDEQLRQKCAIEHLKDIAPDVESYKKFAKHYEIPKGELADITDPLKSVVEKTEAVVLWWREFNPDPTYLRFVNDCLKLREPNLARKMCSLCKTGVEEDPEPNSDTKAKDSPYKSASNSPSSSQLSKIEGMQIFCTTDDEKLEQIDQDDASNIPTDAQGGVARLHLLWDVEQIPKLKIHFLNDGILKDDHWKCGNAGLLTVDTILAWAAVWNSHADNYPQIAEGLATKEKAHIRVEFRRKEISWSKVGTAATWETDKKKPTMVLNLYGMTKADQRSMVIHEFGHALGLDHEHQRSDFWDVLKRFIIPKSDMEDGVKCKKACPAVFRSDNNDAPSYGSEYDPDSIMHYWFDRNWLLPKYRKRADVAKHVTNERDRKVLFGVHDRDYHNGRQAENPSNLDYETLNGAYGTKGTQSEPKLVTRTEETTQSGRKGGRDPPASSPKRTKAGKIKGEQVLMKIGRELGDQWMDVGVALGMKFMDLKNTIENNPKIKHHLKPMEMLQKWQSKAGDSFTYATLASALEEVGLNTCAQTHCYEQ